jgi:hypothetical protein
MNLAAVVSVKDCVIGLFITRYIGSYPLTMVYFMYIHFGSWPYSRPPQGPAVGTQNLFLNSSGFGADLCH